ncbi:acyltransferase [Ruegeria sp. HKCCD7255]|uniref:acyltransferase family protein n=1 Tax=Ruegeria sp. HKCCD7255 TaxID=2683004 RepID=UPI0014878E41|nr:acyltransferase [Ruegeria sp. HKCCD7255]
MYFVNLQYLRAFAAALVAVFHICLFLPDRSFEVGAYGVDIFFVISGFVMYHSGIKLGPGEFMVHRISRIVPLYWMAIFVFIAIDGNTALTTEEVLKSLLFVAYENPGALPPVSPIISVGWTLNLEMFFYVLFALGLAISRQHLVLGLTTLFVFLAVMGKLIHGLDPVMGFYTKGILLEFAAGLIVAKVMNDLQSKLNPLFGLVLCCASFLALYLLQDSGLRIVRWGVPACLIVVGMLALEPVLSRYKSPFLILLGDASYALYLSHLMLIAPAIAALSLVLSPDNGLMIVAVFILCQVAAVGIYILYEKPIYRKLKSMRQRQVARH